MVSSFRISTFTIENDCFTKISDIVTRHIYERCGVRVLDQSNAEMTIELAIDPSIVTDGYRIEDIPGNGIRISANDMRSLLYGIGKYLHGCDFNDGSFMPSSWRGSSSPTRSFRAIFLANHFSNFYQSAPIDEVKRYLEDIAMWGYNRVLLCFDIQQYLLSSQSEFQRMSGRLREVVAVVQSLGLLSGILILDEGEKNEDYLMMKEKNLLVKMAELFHDIVNSEIDFLAIMTNPQGDETDRGFSPLKTLIPEIAEIFKRYFPLSSIAVSMNGSILNRENGWNETVHFVSDNRKYIDYLIYDTTDELLLPAAINNGVPAGLPMLHFAEISKHANFPWGGYGMNPFPHRMQQNWDANKSLSTGGILFSEGIFDDINKVVCAQFFWDDRPAVETVRDYLSYYFGSDIVNELSRVVALMERTTPHTLAMRKVNTIDMLETDGVEEAFFLTKKAETKMTVYARNNWRWRLFFIRAFIDLELTAHQMEITELCNAAFRELEYLYHAQQAATCLKPPTMIVEEI